MDLVLYIRTFLLEKETASGFLSGLGDGHVTE